MYEKLDDFKTRDLPARKLPFWKMAGPGAILVGLSIGAGEIIVWPQIVAEFGAGMIWAAGMGVFLQLWVNLEVARWTIATGETVYTGYARLWQGFSWVFILLTMMGWLAPGWGRASGLALKALLLGPDGWGSDTFWTLVTFVGVAAVLFGPKLIYQSMEKTIELLVIVVMVGLIAVAVAVGTVDTWKELGVNVINIGYLDPDMSIKRLFIAVVFAGAGGTANLFLTFYLRDKHIGMGAHLPTMQNPLWGRSEAIPSTGYRFEETEENISRFQSWWRYVKQDQVLFFWFANSVTILLFIFGALAVLHPRGIVPASGSLIWDEAAILGEVWGAPGRVIFLLVGLATLFSTQLALVDGVSRSIADIVHTNFKGAKKRELNWWYLLVALVWMVIGVGITFVMEHYGVSELGFLFNAAYMGGFAMALYVPLTLYMNFKYLPRSVRPGKICTVMTGAAALIYIAFSIACLLWEVGLF
jgi:hypothetical protein